VTALRRRLSGFFLDPRVYLGSLLVLAGEPYTRYNNFVIFRQAFVHLRAGANLYGDFVAEHLDHFLYSPTFAAAMAPFAALPDWAGLVLWDLTTTSVLVLGLRALPGLDVRTKGLLVWFMAPEFHGAVQNSQSNPMVLGLLFLAFAAAEDDRPPAAAFFLVAATYVKIFPVVAGLAFLVHPRRARLVLWCALWGAVLALVPLLLVPPAQLAWQYGNWWRLHTTSVHSTEVGLSIAGWLQAWFGLEPPRIALVGLGGLLAALPLTNRRAWGSFSFRAAYFGSMLMWMIAFNHLAESPTFVIAMGGIGLWYFAQERTPLRRAVMVLALIFTSAVYSDLVTPAARARWVTPWVLKVVPVILAWAVAVVQLSSRRPGPSPLPGASGPGPARPA
jgi:hypothetical protein